MTMVQEQQLSSFDWAPQATLGFTGTRNGFTSAQRREVFIFLDTNNFTVARHGDCVGSDAMFDELAFARGMVIYIHPCNLLNSRAWTKNFSFENPVKDPLARNKDIVHHSDFVLATPGEMYEKQRGGTWATVRYARNANKPLRIIYPDGSFGD